MPLILFFSFFTIACFIGIAANNDPMSNKWQRECLQEADIKYEKCVLGDGGNCSAKLSVMSSQCYREADKMTEKAIAEQSMWQRHTKPERWPK